MELSPEDRKLLETRRNAILMELSGIEERLGIQSVEQCPQCRHQFQAGRKARRQMRGYQSQSAELFYRGQ